MVVPSALVGGTHPRAAHIILINARVRHRDAGTGHGVDAPTWTICVYPLSTSASKGPSGLTTWRPPGTHQFLINSLRDDVQSATATSSMARSARSGPGEHVGLRGRHVDHVRRRRRAVFVGGLEIALPPAVVVAVRLRVAFAMGVRVVREEVAVGVGSASRLSRCM